jgi:RNA polymerase sigma-70 factor (ECF subfamily)
LNLPSDLSRGKKAFEELLIDARRGSVEAKNELFIQLQTYLTFVAKQARNPNLAAKAGASDIVQQTLLTATQAFDQFRGDTEEQFRGWLRQILINQTNDQHRYFAARRRDARQEHYFQKGDSTAVNLQEPVDLQLTPCSEAIAAERSAAIQGCLEKMPSDLQQVLRLRNWEKLSFREIAGRIGVTTSVAAKLWYRALVELQRLYDKDE